MSVKNVTPEWENIQAPADLDGESAHWSGLVHMYGDDPYYSRPFLARRHYDVPDAREQWSADEPQIRATSISTEMLGPILIRVEVDFEAGLDADHPLDESPTEVSTYVENKEPVETDVYGNPMENTAGVPLDGIEVPVFDAQWRITRNEPDFSPLAMQPYQNSVNAGSFRSAPPGTCLLRVEGREAREAGWTFYEVTYTITARLGTLPDNAKHLDAHGNVVSNDEQLGWRRRIPNKGKMARDSDGNLVTVKDAEGEPVSDPVWLDEQGKEQAQGETRIFLLYEDKFPKDWSPLELA